MALAQAHEWTPDKAHEAFAEVVKKEGRELVAARLRCSVVQVKNIETSAQDPGLRTACAIEECYAIPMNAWVARPASRKI